MLLFLLLSVLARAQESVVALLPMDGVPGTDGEAMERFVAGLSSAVAHDGRVSPLMGVALQSRLTEGQEERLGEARDALRKGEELLRDGEADIAVPFLEESIRAHLDSGSAVVRREELARAHATLARALVLQGDEPGARGQLAEAIRLVPDFELPALPALAEAAREQLRTRPPRQLSSDGAVVLAVDLAVAFLAHGAVMEDGSVELVVFEGPEPLHRAHRPGPFAPPLVGDPWYAQLSDEVVAAALHLPVPRPVSTEVAPPQQEDPLLLAPRPAPRRGQWVLWTATGVVVAGAGAALFLVEPEATQPEPTWTLEVQVP